MFKNSSFLYRIPQGEKKFFLLLKRNWEYGEGDREIRGMVGMKKDALGLIRVVIIF